MGTLARWLPTILLAAATAVPASLALARDTGGERDEPTREQEREPDGDERVELPPDAGDVVTYDLRRRVETTRPSDLAGPSEAFEPGHVGDDLAGTLFSFSQLVPVDNPHQWPASANVKLYAPMPSGELMRCSGTLIDSRHVLTAGHCVYWADAGGWAEEVLAYPGWIESDWFVGKSKFGEHNRAIAIDSFKGWTQNGIYEYDLALIYLDRPVGVQTGWYGYGTASCWALTHNTYENYSYPNQGPLADKFAYWQGSFDWCPLAYMVQANNTGYEGMSGSAAFDYKDGMPVARAVASRKWAAPPGVRYVRLSSSTFSTFYDLIHGRRTSDSNDLIPVGLTVDKDEVKPKAGETVQVSGLRVHNYSNASFAGHVLVQLYLSEDTTITPGSDLLLWSTSAYMQIDALKSQLVSPGQVAIPTDVPAGKYWIGVRIHSPGDSNAANNTGTLDERHQIKVVDVKPDLTVKSVQVPSGTYTTMSQLQVTFQVDNIGEAYSGEWTGRFYLSPLAYFNAQAILLDSGSAPSLPPGGKYVDTVSLTIPGSVPPGNYFVILRVTADDDANTGNNSKSSSPTKISVISGDLKAGHHDLEAHYITFPPGQYSTADTISAWFGVNNIGVAASGSWKARFWALKFGNAPILLAQGSAASLLAGESYAGVEPLSLAQLSSGHWHLVLEVEADQPEPNTDNNVVLSPITFDIPMGFTF